MINEKKFFDYIDARTQQLKEDREKCKKDYDAQWYNRIINELFWVKQISTKPDKNCGLGEI
tara:strand:+ start:126 stop:308 length:183 start_codon:yes stop_codon:yes gene_type:complete